MRVINAPYAIAPPHKYNPVKNVNTPNWRINMKTSPHNTKYVGAIPRIMYG